MAGSDQALEVMEIVEREFAQYLLTQVGLKRAEIIQKLSELRKKKRGTRDVSRLAADLLLWHEMEDLIKDAIYRRANHEH